jgi:hypothetical protein
MLFRCPGDALGPNCGMKQLLPGDVINIPSNLPRTRQGPDSRGIRICFQELGRSCSLQTGYLIFTDGSAYEYDAPGNTPVEQLCVALQRGKQFNFQVRRSRSGFTRGFTPPADYETIYTYPPYAGTEPAACALPGVDWSLLDWTFVHNDSGGMTYTETPGLGMSASQQFFATSATGDSSGQRVSMTASVVYNGPAVNCQVRLQVITTNPTGSTAAAVFLDLGSGFTLAIDDPLPGNFDFTFPFTVADTGGSPVTLGVFFATGGWDATSIGDWTFICTLSNV